jgi:hypothetical protein
MNKRKISAQNVYNLDKSNIYRETLDRVDSKGEVGNDNADNNAEEQDTIPWTSLKVEQIRSAYMLFVHPPLTVIELLKKQT